MGYNAIDLIDRFIDIEERKRNILEETYEKEAFGALKLMEKVLGSQSKKRINNYIELKEKLKGKELEDIDVLTYDKMSFLINEFNNRIYNYNTESIKEYLKSWLSVEKDNYSLFIDIQGRLVNNTSNKSIETYKILSEIIEMENKEVASLEKILK